MFLGNQFRSIFAELVAFELIPSERDQSFAFEQPEKAECLGTIRLTKAQSA
jgi:hypothetical protein